MLIGGHCSTPFNRINVYSLASNTWVREFGTEQPRSYHSTVLYKNRYGIIFGGMGQYSKTRKVRDCLRSITLVDAHNYTTKDIRMHNEEVIEPRRCHSAVLFGKAMFVLGGINSGKQFLSDLIYLDLKELRWHHKEYKAEGELEQFLVHGIAKHCAVSWFRPRKTHSFYSSDYEDTEGIYFLGGFNQREEENTLFQLFFNTLVPTFRRVDYVGAPPSPVNPIVEKYSNHADTFLIISGETSEREIRLFRPKDRTFIFINCYASNSPLGGLGSSINLHAGKYFLFYGLGEQGYLGHITQFQITEEKREDIAKRENLKAELSGPRLGLSRDSSSISDSQIRE